MIGRVDLSHSSRRLRCLLAAAFVSLVGWAQGAPAQISPTTPAFPPASPEDFGLEAEVRELSDSLHKWTDSGRIVGGELLVVTGDRTVWHEAAGWADVQQGRRLAVNSLFRIRSMTKPIVGSAILMLQDDGLLSVSDRVSRYLPEFDNGRSRDVTIRELLTHTSGFGDHGVGEIDLPRRGWEYESLADLVSDLGAVGPTRTRGELRYSDSNSAILAAVVSAVSRMPVEDFLHQRIFSPLGMQDSHAAFAPDSAWADRLSSTYRWSAKQGEFERYWDPSRPEVYGYFEGSGGVYSTPRDFAKLLDLWVDQGVHDGARLLSDTAIRTALGPERGKIYGYHWALPNSPALDGGPRSFFHGGSDGTIGIAIPSQDVLILLFTQSRGVPVDAWLFAVLSRMERFAPFVVADFRNGSTHPDELPAESGIPEAQLHRYTGTFESEDRGGRSIEVWRHEAGLRFRVTLRENAPATAPYDLIGIGHDRFVLGRIVDGVVAEATSRPPVEFHALSSSDDPQGRFLKVRALRGVFRRSDN